MADNRPLAGIRVVELGIAVAAPVGARYMAHMGAEVIKVESPLQPDAGRLIGPGWIPREQVGARVWMDMALASEYNAGKLSVSLNLKAPEGIAAARRLLAQSDVFTSNYSAEALRSLGLDYESVRRVKPDIIHLTLSGFGTTLGTPYHNYIVFGPNLTSLAGIDTLTSDADGRVAGIMFVGYTDWVNAILGATAVLAALEHRDETGEGQAIDLSQYEAAVGLLGPELLNYELTGQGPVPGANRLPFAAPQGVYCCRGNDRWVALSIFTEDEWRSLCRIVGHSEWTSDERFQTLEDRLAHHDELDALIGDWTIQHTQHEVAEWLQWAGVAACPVMDHPQLAFDPHLASRDYWLLPEHSRWGKELVSANPICLSDTPGHIERAVPSVGEDNQYVLGKVCGYSDSEIQDMIDKGAVYPMDHPEVTAQRRYLPWIRHFMPQLPWPAPAS